MLEYSLSFGPDWARQIEGLRNAVTEDTNLIRFDNAFYRICRGGTGVFRVRLHPGFGSRASPVTLDMVEKDLYVTEINHRPFEQYSKLLNTLPQDPTPVDLNSALTKLETLKGPAADLQRSLLVFAVAESLRSDLVATAIEQAIRRNMGTLFGVPLRLQWPMLHEAQAHHWGQVSEKLYGALTREAQALVVRPRKLLNEKERQFSERIDLSGLSDEERSVARGIKVLKWPKQPVVETVKPKAWGR